MLRAIDGLGAFSVTDWWPVRGIVLAATVLAGLLTLRHARRVSSIVLATALLAGLVTANLVLAANSYYGTYPTLSTALGNRPQNAPAVPPGVPPTGQSVPVVIPGDTSGFATRPALVHLPPAWFAQPRPQLPVVMLLHGSPGGPSEWIDPGTAGRVADTWADRNGGVAPILVLPDLSGEAGTGVCADTAGGKVETYLTVDVPAFVTARFSAQPPGPSWAVAGHTAGGTCAVTLALRHADSFGAFADFGGPGGAVDVAHDPATLLGLGRYPGLAGWFETSDADPALVVANRLAQLAQAADIDTCLVVRTGTPPGPSTWSLAFADALPYLAARVGQVPPTPEMASRCQLVPPT